MRRKMHWTLWPTREPTTSTQRLRKMPGRLFLSILTAHDGALWKCFVETKFPLVVASGTLIDNHTLAVFSPHELPLTPSSCWFSVLNRVHSASPEQLMEMHHEQANPKNAVVSAGVPLELRLHLSAPIMERITESVNTHLYSLQSTVVRSRMLY